MLELGDAGLAPEVAAVLANAVHLASPRAVACQRVEDLARAVLGRPVAGRVHDGYRAADELARLVPEHLIPLIVRVDELAVACAHERHARLDVRHDRALKPEA